MERLSNNYEGLISKIYQELQNVELNENEYLVIRYTELPSFPGGQFSVSVIASTKENYLKIVKQSWDHEYDLKRFSSGIYNLDRLCILKKRFDLSRLKQKELTEIIDSINQIPDALNDESYIVLDGIDYQLTLNFKNINKEYQWRIPTKDIGFFEPLLTFLKATVSVDQAV